MNVPVIHASHAGPFEGYESPELPDVPCRSVYLGEAMITDSTGKILARRSMHEGAGVVLAEVAVTEGQRLARGGVLLHLARRIGFRYTDEHHGFDPVELRIHGSLYVVVGE